MKVLILSLALFVDCKLERKIDPQIKENSLAVLRIDSKDEYFKKNCFKATLIHFENEKEDIVRIGSNFRTEKNIYFINLEKGDYYLQSIECIAAPKIKETNRIIDSNIYFFDEGSFLKSKIKIVENKIYNLGNIEVSKLNFKFGQTKKDNENIKIDYDEIHPIIFKALFELTKISNSFVYIEANYVELIQKQEEISELKNIEEELILDIKNSNWKNLEILKN